MIDFTANVFRTHNKKKLLYVEQSTSRVAYGIYTLVIVQRNFSTSYRCKHLHENIFVKNEVNNEFMTECCIGTNK